jgi:hypothetical protein
VANETFIQYSRLGRVIFQLRDDFLDVACSRMGRLDERRIRLRTIDPDFQRLSRHGCLLIIVPGSVVLICAAALWAILHQDALPRELAVWPGEIMCLALWAAIRGTPPFVFYLFRNHWGRPVVSIIRERRQAAECDAFVASLVQRIELAAAGLAPEEIARSLATLSALEKTAAGPDAFREIGQDR